MDVSQTNQRITDLEYYLDNFDDITGVSYKQLYQCEYIVWINTLAEYDGFLLSLEEEELHVLEHIYIGYSMYEVADLTGYNISKVRQIRKNIREKYIEWENPTEGEKHDY